MHGKMTMIALWELASACQPECRCVVVARQPAQRTQTQRASHASVDRLKSSLTPIFIAYIHLYSSKLFFPLH